MDPTKKISFGFSKINKKLNLNNNKESQKLENKVELIKCLEGQEIKLVQEKPQEVALVIPLKENQKTSTALASLMKRRAVLLGEEEEQEQSSDQMTNAQVSNDTANEHDDIEKRAAKELLAELKSNGSLNSDTNLVLPVVHPNDLPLEGAKESSIDDYDSIPIQEFGKAMLRGMGWVEPTKPTKGGPPADDMPSVRPKGMGLGADKALKAKPLLVAPDSNEVLEIRRNAYVRILGGKHKDLYGQIEGFDDHAGRVIVKMAIGGAKEAFNEFLCQPISRKEYSQYGKCINSNKYEEYKRKENEHGQIVFKDESKDKIADKVDKFKIKKEGSHRRDSDKYTDEKDSQRVVHEISSEEEDIKVHNSKFKQGQYEEQKNNNYEKRRQRNDDHEKRHREDEYEERRRRGYDRDESRRKDDYYKKDGDRSRHVEKDVERSSERDKEHRKESAYKSDRNREYKTNEQNYRVEDQDKRRRQYNEYETSSPKSERRRNDEEIKDGRYRQRENSRDNTKDYDDRKNRQRDHSATNESESEDHNKRKKSHKDKKSKKKSKKTKKGKSKYNDSSDSESSSTSSDSEEERIRKHKKKTKKSKKTT